MTLLEGKVAVVTGGAQGLGYAIAQTLVTHGAKVVLGDINGSAAQLAARNLGESRAIGLECNVTSEADMQTLISSAVQHFGSIDVMMNNAGITRDNTMKKMSFDDFSAVIDIHLKGTWLGLKYASLAMREQNTGGSIINMSSISGKSGNPGQTNYSAAKAGIVGMTKAAAKELGFAGIRVNALQPGIIETAMTQSLSEEVRANRLADIPLGRFGEPEDVANAALFLASDLSSYLTGIVIEIAGGRNI